MVGSFDRLLTFCKETGVGQCREDVVCIWDEVALLVYKAGASEALVCTPPARLHMYVTDTLGLLSSCRSEQHANSCCC